MVAASLNGVATLPVAHPNHRNGFRALTSHNSPWPCHPAHMRPRDGALPLRGGRECRVRHRLSVRAAPVSCLESAVRGGGTIRACHERGQYPSLVHRWAHDDTHIILPFLGKIGRASCRERVEISVGGGAVNDKGH